MANGKIAKGSGIESANYAIIPECFRQIAINSLCHLGVTPVRATPRHAYS
jgi:hypothetical protein